MKKILSMIAILTVAVFAETNSTERTFNQKEIHIIHQNKTNMGYMDKVDKEIRVINVSIEKHKQSIYSKFKEMEKVFDNYECEQQKTALKLLKFDIKSSENISTEELEESKVILQRLETKLAQKCGGH